MTEATIQALDGLRDLSTVKWYIIPILLLIFYVYVKEIKLARSDHYEYSRRWFSWLELLMY